MKQTQYYVRIMSDDYVSFHMCWTAAVTRKSKGSVSNASESLHLHHVHRSTDMWFLLHEYMGLAWIFLSFEHCFRQYWTERQTAQLPEYDHHRHISCLWLWWLFTQPVFVSSELISAWPLSLSFETKLVRLNTYCTFSVSVILIRMNA